MRLRRTFALVLVTGVVATSLGVAAARRAPATPGAASARVVRDADHALRAHVGVRVERPTRVQVVAVDEDGHGLRVTPDRPAAGSVRIPLLGLRPDRRYTVTVEGDGQAVPAGRIATREPPAPVPPVEAALPSADIGLTVFETLYRAADGEPPLRDEGAVVAVDGRGEVVWYEVLPQGAEDVTPTPRGTLLVTAHEMGIREIDPAEGTVAHWVGRSAEDATDAHGRAVASDDAIMVATDQMHHEVIELPNGNLLTLSREVREVTYPEPICEDSPASGTEAVAADTLVEFRRDTGEIVREFSLFDVLDPTSRDSLDRIVPSEFCSPYLDPRYPQGGVRDWTHANGIEIDPDLNVVWISARHLDQLVGLRWVDDDAGEAGELVYRLGPGGDFALADGGQWFLHQHAPELQPDGTLQVYDNGNWRDGTDVEDPTALPWSRAVRYRLDTRTMTATQVWEHAFPQDEGVYAPYVGDADTLDDGRVLIAHGGLLDPLAESPNAPGVQRWGRIVEVDPGSGEVVWDLVTRDPDGETGWGLYRAERIPHLYPPGWTVEPVRPR